MVFQFVLPRCPLRPVMLNNARPSRITAAAGTKFAGTISFKNVIIYIKSMGFTTNTVFITHVIWLDHAFAHCPIFLTAAARKRLGRVSVPMWLIILSD